MQRGLGEAALHRCINLCKVAKSTSAPCSEVPAPCSLFQQLILLLSDYLLTMIKYKC
ncbi:hypothetical protein [Moorena sp. SIO3H5]|uniref:hypothetical protein n=1 Tax=Moorena sp. SIO3H5 TaxID=2607834 RepID=UPI0013BA6B76|nr:hypothetical protein [Moorena sp. SIO3H5]NEO71266.1 hypothetical protein [Moorena sp. SIO3H5]